MHVFGQASPFVRVQTSRSSLFVQEPFRVTITVLTPTWFTAPPDFNHLEIPNCFILPFDQTVPGMFDVGRKKYAGIQFYYIVFPYKPGKFTVPPFSIDVMSPKEGTANSIRWKLRSGEIPFLVKEIPVVNSQGYWLVAKNILLRETWSKSLAHLKVGDVLERSDVIDARGTLPQFIPTVPMADPEWASVYPKDAILKDERNDNDANGSRQQKTVYLLEKEGEFTFPAFKVSWWNPQTQRMLSRTVKPVRVQVAENPNLGILQTIRDSLSTKPSPQTIKRKGPQTIWGIVWYKFLLFAILILSGIYFLVLICRNLMLLIRSKIQKYKSSELYWFRKFEKGDSHPDSVIRNFYKWWDRRTDNKIPYVNEGPDTRQSELMGEWQKTVAGFYGSQPETMNTGLLRKQTAQFRRLNKDQEQKLSGLSNIQSEWPVET